MSNIEKICTRNVVKALNVPKDMIFVPMEFFKKAEIIRKRYVEASTSHHIAFKDLNLTEQITKRLFDDGKYFGKTLTFEKKVGKFRK